MLFDYKRLLTVVMIVARSRRDFFFFTLGAKHKQLNFNFYTKSVFQKSRIR